MYKWSMQDTKTAAVAIATKLGKAGVKHVLYELEASYDATFTGLLTLYDGATLKASFYVYNQRRVQFPGGIQFTAGNSIYAELSAGSVGVVGSVVMHGATARQISHNPAVPAAPTTPDAVAGAVKVTLTWDAVAGAESYNLYWSTNAVVNKRTATKIAGVSSGYEHTGRTGGVAYYYAIAAVIEEEEGPLSAEVTDTALYAAPAGPANIIVLPGILENVIHWSTVPNATAYNVYWKLTSPVTIANGTKVAGQTSPYTHTGRTAAVPVYYIVSAETNGGEGTASDEASGTPTAS